jgi:spermidine synthase
VVERLPEVIAWHRRGLVPLAAQLIGEPRCQLLEGDCLQLLRDGGGERYDAILIDIDDSPIHLLDEAHAGFYAVAGLRAVRQRLHPGGVFALWTSLPAEPEVTARLQQAFAQAHVEEVRFDNPLLDEPEVNALYFGRA